MDSLDTVLVPEAGQTNAEPGSNTPATADEGGMAQQPQHEPDAQASQEPSEEMIPKSQYDNLRRDYTKKAMELADYKKGRKPVPQAQPAYQQPQLQTQPQVQNQAQPSINFGEYIDNIIEERMAPLAEKQRDLFIQTTVQSLADQYDDFNEVSDKFVETLENNPALLDMEGGIELAFRAARSEYLDTAAEAEAIAKEQARMEITANKAAQSVTGISSKQAAAKAPQTEEDAIRDSILSAGGNFRFNF